MTVKREKWRLTFFSDKTSAILDHEKARGLPLRMRNRHSRLLLLIYFQFLITLCKKNVTKIIAKYQLFLKCCIDLSSPSSNV